MCFFPVVATNHTFLSPSHFFPAFAHKKTADVSLQSKKQGYHPAIAYKLKLLKPMQKHAYWVNKKNDAVEWLVA
ncbi:hypothetical protein CHH78_02870 [Shouchella clausii]|uniref:Uncharacterized protein n=1 Tax=Shouchella clausii TaxID=79880 RepID=A0A268S6E6_SHOCL|nr:hypothetical protein CHH76_02710 [Shouchella clausii]PAD43738.1 hypothetical protein CHH54_06275 [Bacillus sp. 7520-S]PAD12862.1 hypothetical protein CHH74_13600 [Shouchella clausii]PAD92190.1 hypothetical protein CHH52_11200 [Shouchella clausii]PAE86091.1 hypothetical protein CHH78_02870 [Shouchella clausii]